MTDIACSFETVDLRDLSQLPSYEPSPVDAILSRGRKRRSQVPETKRITAIFHITPRHRLSDEPTAKKTNKQTDLAEVEPISEPTSILAPKLRFNVFVWLLFLLFRSIVLYVTVFFYNTSLPSRSRNSHQEASPKVRNSQQKALSSY